MRITPQGCRNPWGSFPGRQHVSEEKPRKRYVIEFDVDESNLKSLIEKLKRLEVEILDIEPAQQDTRMEQPH
jgi:hypothetical protein